MVLIQLVQVQSLQQTIRLGLYTKFRRTFLDRILQTQQIDIFPSKSFRILVKIRKFLPTLVDLGKTFDLKKFLALLSKHWSSTIFNMSTMNAPSLRLSTPCR